MDDDKRRANRITTIEAHRVGPRRIDVALRGKLKPCPRQKPPSANYCQNFGTNCRIGSLGSMLENLTSDHRGHRLRCAHYGTELPPTNSHNDFFCECHKFSNFEILASGTDIAWPRGWDPEMADYWRKKNNLQKPLGADQPHAQKTKRWDRWVGAQAGQPRPAGW